MAPATVSIYRLGSRRYAYGWRKNCHVAPAGKYACSGERKGLAGISRLVCVSPRLQRLIANSIIIGWKEIRC